MSYVYLTTPFDSEIGGDSETGGDIHTVGHYSPDGKWIPESDHNTIESAEDRINFLQGGASVGLRDAYKKLSAQNQELRKQNFALLDYVTNPSRYNEIQRRAMVENKRYDKERSEGANG